MISTREKKPMQIFQKGNQIHFLQSNSSLHKRLLIESLDLISSYVSYKLVQIPHDEVIHIVAISLLKTRNIMKNTFKLINVNKKGVFL